MKSRGKSLKRQSTLTAFGIRHAVDLDGRAEGHVGHVLGRNQNVLFLVRLVSGLDL